MTTSAEHQDYLQSEHWQKFRRISIEANPQCARCEMPRWLAKIAYDQDINVHHVSYKNKWSETLADVENLCRRCHDIESFGRTELREPKSATCGVCGSKHWNPYLDYCGDCALLLQLDGYGKWIGRWLEIPQKLTEQAAEPIWKSVLREICNRISCGDAGTAGVVDELAKIENEYLASDQCWLAKLESQPAAEAGCPF